MYTKEVLEKVLKSHGIELQAYHAGDGGSAVVHHAWLVEPNDKIDLTPPVELAVKEYKDEILGQKSQLERIRQEAEVGQKLRHENVVGIRCLIETIEGPPLLVMDWIDGVPLSVWHQKLDGRKPTWEEFKTLTSGLVTGLAALHQHRIRHRDFKPANVFVKKSNFPIIMDMGVVEIAADTEQTLHTSVKDFIGSIRYAAPQFIRGEEFDYSDDIYSFAATLYLLVTGKEIFSEIDRKPLLPHYILTQTPRVGEVSEGLPSQLSVLLEGALHPDRKRRPTIDEIKGFLNDPEHAPYMQRELDARNKEQRGFEVIEVMDDGATILADLRGAEPRGEFIQSCVS